MPLMQTLIVVPIQEEVDCFQRSYAEAGFRAEAAQIGNVTVARYPELGVTLGAGGLGKTQFAIQTQYMIDNGPKWDLIICAGAGGALVNGISVGDVVIATETVEHDIHNKFGAPLIPRFNSDTAVLESFRNRRVSAVEYRIHFAPIASGDEDVVDTKRRREIQLKTGASVVAWEGAGGARACQFSRVPFIEIRGVSDVADSTAAADFAANLEIVMRNVAHVIINWSKVAQRSG